MKETKDMKFNVKADLAVFEALQKDGTLSEEGIAKITNIPATTVHYAMERIRQRNFFSIKAVPMLEKFQEIPQAIIGFSNVHPVKLRQLRDRYINKVELRQFFNSEKDVLLYVMDVSMDALTKRVFDIMELLEEKPCVYMTSPVIAKFDATIPDKVLETVYSEIPDRRIRV